MIANLRRQPLLFQERLKKGACLRCEFVLLGFHVEANRLLSLFLKYSVVEIKYYVLISEVKGVGCPLVELSLKMQVNDAHCYISVDERKKIDTALATLKSLRARVSDLRAHCEALKLESETQEGTTCSECGKPIDEYEEITLKDSFGNIKSYFHKDCFKAIWLSQNWKFDYSAPGFFRMSGVDQ